MAPADEAKMKKAVRHYSVSSHPQRWHVIAVYEGGSQQSLGVFTTRVLAEDAIDQHQRRVR
jgi:hypothetical protein